MNIMRNQPKGVAKLLGVREEKLEKIVTTLDEWHQWGEAAMQFAFFKHGELVLEVAVGRDPFTGKLIDSKTLFCLLSTTKALAAMVMLYLHDKDFFEWTDRIATYWPAFAQGGKEEATIEHLLSHRIGIPGLTTHWHH